MQSGGPGWNDPPNLTYKVHSETTSRRHVLNQRVSYLDHPPSELKPTTSLNPNLPPPTTMCSKKTDEAASGDSSALPVSNEELDVDWIGSLRSLAEKSKSQKIICQKIDIAQKMVEEKKLSEQVESKMKKLVNCLEKKEYDEAWKLHVQMMCDHVSEVGLWMIGVKKLISELKTLQK